MMEGTHLRPGRWAKHLVEVLHGPVVEEVCVGSFVQSKLMEFELPPI
jgi:hypothetical protein